MGRTVQDLKISGITSTASGRSSIGTAEWKDGITVTHSLPLLDKAPPSLVANFWVTEFPLQVLLLIPRPGAGSGHPLSGVPVSCPVVV